MPWEVKQNGDQYCVYKIGESTPIKGGCHSTREEAIAQQRALYASYSGSKNFALAFAETAEIGSEDGLLWLEALPAKTWYDPRWGEVPITPEKLERFVKNFNDGVRGQEITTDYEHGFDPAKGKKASGTYRKLDIRPRDDGTVSLWAGIEPTSTAAEEIKNKEWKYFSVEWEDEWIHPDTQQKHEDVITGGGLTNRPVAKGMLPINFSEVFVELSSEDAKKFAVWTAAYVNNLPDSAFFWIESGGSKDSEGKTVPRSKRHLPYKDANGNVDLPHVRNAMARASQVSGIPSAVVSRVQAMGKRLLGAKNMAEVLTIEAEMAPEYFQEPGTGIVDPSINEDDSYGDRLDTPPPGEDGSVPNRSKTVTDPNKNEGGEEMNEEQLLELRKLLGIAEDADVDTILATTKEFSEELEPLRELRKKVEAKKKFAEEYPEEAERLQKLEVRDREHFSKQFSESFEGARIEKHVKEGDEVKKEPTTLGFSAVVLDEIGKMAKQFSEGAPTLEQFKGVVDAVLDNGIVDYGNKGSERQPEVETDNDVVPAAGSMEARKLFAEKIEKIVEEDKLDFEAAMVEATKRHPKLAEAYRQPPVVAG